MKIFPYKELQIMTNLSKSEVYSAFRQYSSSRNRINISYISLKGIPDYTESYFYRDRFGPLRIIDVHFIGDAKELGGQTSIYGIVEPGIIHKMMAFLAIAVTAWLLRSVPMLALPSVIIVSVLMYLFVKSNVKKFTPYFEEEIKGILKLAERIKAEGKYS